MVVFDSIMDEGMIGNSQYFFQRNEFSYSLHKTGCTSPLLTEIKAFLSFEENHNTYIILRMVDEIYSIYVLVNNSTHIERIVSIYPGKNGKCLPMEFCVELDFGNSSDKVYGLLENLEFKKEPPISSKTVKMKNHHFSNNNVNIVVGNDELFTSVIVSDGKANTRYICA